MELRTIRRLIVTAALALAAFVALLCGGAGARAEADKPATVTIDGIRQSYEQPPVIVDGTTLVPLRAIFEALGANITWDSGTQTVIARKEFKQVTLTVGDARGFIDSREQKLDQPATIVDGHTMVPLRFVSEAFGCQVGWDGETKTVAIRTGLPTDGLLAKKAPYELLEPVTAPDRKSIAHSSPPASIPTVRSAYNTPHWFEMKRQWKTFSTTYFQVYYYESEADVMTVAAQFDDIYRFLTGVFGHRLFYKVPVYFMSEQDYADSNKELSFSSAHWNLAEQTMFMKFDDKMSLDSLLQTFRHEMTHAITLSSTDSRLEGEPNWFMEAVATYYESIAPYYDLSREKFVYDAWKAGKLIAWKDIPENNGHWNEDNVALIYSQAQSVYRYLVKTYGEDKTNALFYAPFPFDEAVQKTFRVSVAQLESDWLADLQQHYAADSPADHGVVAFSGKGNRYVGEMKRGAPNGRGSYYTDYMLVYEGESREGKFDGSGTYYFADGSSVEGTFKNGKINGHAQRVSAGGKLTFEGEFVDDKPNGPGKYYFNDGARFEGQLADGKFASGKYYLANGSLLYEGEFRDDQFEGKGTLYSNGYKYVGDFKNGKPDGYGKVYRTDGTYVNEGLYRNGQPVQ